MRTILKGNQDGLVAITTTLVIMIIMTLIITSFTLVVRREQRQSLDRQLSTQAFYAAETGIQDAINALQQGAITSNINSCTGAGSYESALGTAGITYNNLVSQSSDINNVSYSCVLIDKDPGELKYDVLNPNTGTYIMAIHSNTGDISSLRFSWQNTVEVGSTDEFEAPGSTTFPKDPGTLKTGLPRVTVMPGSFNQDSIADQTRTFFMYPSEGGSGTASLSDSSGGIVSGNCSTSHPDDPYNCNVEITTDGTSNTYFVAIKALYKPIAFQINAYDSVAQNLHIEGAQAIVDVTGKAEDVLRRVQVRVPYESDIVPSKLGEMLPLAGIEATNTICKQFKVTDAQYEDLCTAGNLITPTDMTPTGSPTTTPNPSGPGTSGPNGSGNSAIGGNTTSGSGSGSGNNGNATPTYRPYEWGRRMYNRSTNDPSIVDGCTWDFGDGQVVQNQACLPGEYIVHTFPTYPTPIDAPAECRRYLVYLTIHFNNGYPDEVSNHYVANIPYGTEGNALCTGQWH